MNRQRLLELAGIEQLNEEDRVNETEYFEAIGRIAFYVEDIAKRDADGNEEQYELLLDDYLAEAINDIKSQMEG